MADAGSFNADLGINMQFNIDSAGLTEVTKTIKEISKGKDLQRYWKDVETATNNASEAMNRYSRNIASEDLAKNFIKQINALKALTNNKNLSELFPNSKLNIDGLLESAKKVVPKINSEFSVESFSQAFNTFDLLKEKALDLKEVFSMLSDYADVVKKNSNLNRENNEFRQLIGDMDVSEVKSKLSEVKNLRDEAEDIFESFLKVNNIERKDFWGNENFSEYFNGIRAGLLTATEAMAKFKTEYAHLLEDSFKTNNDTFGIEQLQAFSAKLDGIFRQVEETSTKINDIISNGVLTKSVENLSADSSLTSSQRSMFSNLLQDEESLKSITSLFKKLIEESNKTSKVELFNDEQLQYVLSIFEKIEKHLSSLRSIISDVGDGEEFSPLLMTIEKINASISELSANIKGISLNMNIDVGSNKELDAKYEEKVAKALSAYQRLFEHIKTSGVGSSVINTKFFGFDINQFDSMMGKLTAYQKFIKDMREETKNQFNGKDVLRSETDPKYWNQVSAALAQISKVENEMKASATQNPLSGMFEKTDLSGIISQLDKIIAKLEEISTSASDFKAMLTDGLNVTSSTEEIDKLTNKVKELEEELSKIKLNPMDIGGNKSNISSENKSNVEASTSAIKEESKALGQVSETAKEASASKEKFAKANKNVKVSAESSSDALDEEKTKLKDVGESAENAEKVLETMEFKPNTEGFDDIVAKFKLLQSEAEQIVKIIKETRQAADGLDVSYTAKLKNGSSYSLGERSNPQILKASEVAYDAKAVEQETKAVKKTWEENVKAIKAYIKAVTELNNLKIKDSKTGRYDKTIEQKKKEIEELREVAEKARMSISSMINPHNVSSDTWKEYLSVRDMFDQASKGSVEPIEKLDAHMKKLKDSQINSVNSLIETFKTDYEKLTIKKPDGERSIKYQNNLVEYLSLIKQLEEESERLSKLDFISDEELSKFNKLKEATDKCADSFKLMNAAEKGSTHLDRNKELDRISKYLKENTRLSRKAKDELEGYIRLLQNGNGAVNVKEIHDAFLNVVTAERLAGREGKSFFDIFKNKAVYGFASQLAMYYLSFYDFIRYARNAVSAVVELDTALIDLKKTTSMNSNQLEEFYYSSNNVAKQMGVTTSEIINQASAWSRLGYGTKEASTQMAQLSSQFASISPGMETDQAQEGLVSIMKAWGISEDQVKSEIMDPINTLGNKFAESNADIVEGMKRSAAALAAVGTDYRDAYALFTGAQEILQSSEVTGRALRSISLRVRGYSESSEDGLLETDEELKNITGDLIDLTKTAEHTQGVSIFKDGSTTEFKSLVEYFGEISEIWDEMSEKQQNDYLNKAFAKTQANFMCLNVQKCA